MDCYFTKYQTSIIKGLALILMFIHHFFTFPQNIVISIDYNNLAWFAGHFCHLTKICVPVFAFLTGYFFMKKEKSLRGGVKRICCFLVCYWTAYFPLLLVAIILGVYPLSIKRVLLEMIGISNPVMTFCWYVNFYIIMLFLLTAIHYLIEYNAKLGITICGVGLLVYHSVIVFIAQNELENGVVYIIQYVWMYFPVTIIGYILARRRYFEKIGTMFNTVHESIRILTAILAVVLAFLFRVSSIYWVMGEYLTGDIITAPLFVWGIVELTQKNENWFLSGLSVIGKYSMFMWFFHCVFFNCTKQYTQWLLYWPRNPILVLLWGLLFCLILSVGAKRIVEAPCAFINKNL